jgi:hypothetical protein
MLKGPLIYLFGHDKLKLLKFFFYNQEKFFELGYIAEKTDIEPKFLQKELKNAQINDVVEVRKNNKVNQYGLKLNPTIIKDLGKLIFDIDEEFIKEVKKKVLGLGEIQACVLQGMFIKEEYNRVDLFLVIDEVNEKKFENFISFLESELGREICYTVLSKEEFEYRKNMFDKFVWSIIENKNARLLVDNINILKVD